MQCPNGPFLDMIRKMTQKGFLQPERIEFHLERAFRIMPHKTEEKVILWQFFAGREDGMGFFRKKKPACLYGSEKEKDVIKNCIVFWRRHLLNRNS